MRFFEWINESVSKMDWLDISLIKLSVFAFALLVAKYYPSLLSLEWYFYVAVFVLAVVRPMSKMFK